MFNRMKILSWVFLNFVEFSIKLLNKNIYNLKKKDLKSEILSKIRNLFPKWFFIFCLFNLIILFFTDKKLINKKDFKFSRNSSSWKFSV